MIFLLIPAKPVFAACSYTITTDPTPVNQGTQTISVTFHGTEMASGPYFVKFNDHFIGHYSFIDGWEDGPAINSDGTTLVVPPINNNGDLGSSGGTFDPAKTYTLGLYTNKGNNTPTCPAVNIAVTNSVSFGTCNVSLPNNLTPNDPINVNITGFSDTGESSGYHVELHTGQDTTDSSIACPNDSNPNCNQQVKLQLSQTIYRNLYSSN